MQSIQDIRSLKYYQTEKFEFLKIPYKTKWFHKDNDVKNWSYMLVALPKSHNDSLTCDEFNEAVDMLAEVNNDEYLLYLGDEYDDFTHENVEYKIDLKLPKFELEDPLTSLKKCLQMLGISSVFNVNRTNSNGDRIFVSDVFHKTLIKVDEKGTEAAAVTFLPLETSACLNRIPPRVVTIPFAVDHPFYITPPTRSSV